MDLKGVTEKIAWQPGLLKYAVCRVSGFDALINWKSSICNRAVPDIMITFPLSL